jgi:hypothetical protein
LNNPNKDNHIYIYAYESNTIKGCVRIDTISKEIGYAYVPKEFRNLGIFRELCRRRNQFILDNYDELFFLLTEHDYLVDVHTKLGMTLNPKTKDFDRTDNKNYWRLEINRPVKELLARLTYNNGGHCSGIYIDDNIILTAAHCMKIKNDNTDDPTEIIHNITNLRSNFTHSEHFGYDASHQYKDIGYVQSTTNINASNIYLLDNPEDLPNDFEILCYGQTTCMPNGKKITIVNNLIRKMEDYPAPRTAFREKLDAIIDQENVFLGNDINGDFVENDENAIASIFKHITFINDYHGLQGGDSGGPFGFYFGKKTQKYLNGKKFAVIGNVSINKPFIINVSPLLKS